MESAPQTDSTASARPNRKPERAIITPLMTGVFLRREKPRLLNVTVSAMRFGYAGSLSVIIADLLPHFT
jgi:hypothetical protein